MKSTFQKITRQGGSFLFVALVAGLAFTAEAPRMMSKAEAKELIAKASTPEDHHQLAIYFTQKADKMEAEAVEHDQLAAVYFQNPGNDEMKRSWSATSAGHCRMYAKEARKAAAEDRALAAAHEGMAKTAKK